MKKKKISYLILILLAFQSCKDTTHFIYSPDRKQCITIKDFGNKRYIIDGKHDNIPDNNYVKLDISDIDSEIDEIAGCWENKNYKWLIINDKTIILKNKLDTLKFKFKTNFPKDNGIPTLKNFINIPCYNFGLNLLIVNPKNGAIIE